MPRGFEQHRIVSAVAAAAMVALIGTAMLLGLRPGVFRPVTQTLATVFTEPAPPPPSPPKRPPPPRASRPAPKSASRSAAAAAPAAPQAKPLPVAAPPLPLPPIVVLPTPAAAPVAGSGAATTSGAASAGSGTGGGGAGSGSGAGGSGGTGAGGDDDGVAVRARQTKGKLSVGDLLDRLFPKGQDATVKVRYSVGTDGRVSGCQVTASSGQPEFDARVCALIEQRFRYDPARNRAGQPVAQVIEGTHSWFTPKKG